MQEIHKQPDAISTLYSELLHHAMRPVPDGSNISFKKKKIGQNTYWYLYTSLGRRRIEHYLGPESVQLLENIEKEKALWAGNRPERQYRAKLVSSLLAGGALATPPNEGKVLALLERGGVFLAGGVLIGTIAYRAYANLLGVTWPSDTQTRDIDLADDTRLKIASRPDPEISLQQLLEQSGMGFIPVPSLDRKSPITEFSLRGQGLSVECLTPMRGKPDGKPVYLQALNAWAEPVRYIDYLLDNVQIAVLLYGYGILVSVPSPARFALHKLVVSQRRASAFAEKSRRDLRQAESLLSVLIEQRPGDLILAYEAAQTMGKRFLQQMNKGMGQIDHTIYKTTREILNGY